MTVGLPTLGVLRMAVNGGAWSVVLKECTFGDGQRIADKMRQNLDGEGVTIAFSWKVEVYF